MQEPNIAAAVQALGGLSETARRIVAAGLAKDMSPQNVYNWVNRGFCPPKYAAWIERQTGFPREFLISDELQPLLEDLCADPEDASHGSR